MEENKEGREGSVIFNLCQFQRMPIALSMWPSMLCSRLLSFPEGKRTEGQNDCWWAGVRGWGTGAVSRLRWMLSWTVPRPPPGCRAWMSSDWHHKTLPAMTGRLCVSYLCQNVLRPANVISLCNYVSLSWVIMSTASFGTLFSQKEHMIKIKNIKIPENKDFQYSYPQHYLYSYFGVFFPRAIV